MQHKNIIPIDSHLSVASVRKINGGLAHEKLALPSKNGRIIISLSDIFYVQAASNYSHLMDINGNRYTMTKTLKSIEQLLPNKSFFRCHQSYLINMNYLTEINRDGTLTLKSQEHRKIIPVARRKRSEMKRMFYFI